MSPSRRHVRRWRRASRSAMIRSWNDSRKRSGPTTAPIAVRCPGAPTRNHTMSSCLRLCCNKPKYIACSTNSSRLSLVFLTGKRWHALRPKRCSLSGLGSGIIDVHFTSNKLPKLLLKVARLLAHYPRRMKSCDNFLVLAPIPLDPFLLLLTIFPTHSSKPISVRYSSISSSLK